MREGTTEYALKNMFEIPLLAHEPLNTIDRLGNPNFQIAFSFVYGDDDWVGVLDEGASLALVNQHPFSINPCPRSETYAKHYILPSSDHNMHMDNPLGFANITINDLLNPQPNLPVMSVDDYAIRLGIRVDNQDYGTNIED